MEYILTTTKKWGRPLEFIEFIIKIPESYQLINLSFPYLYRKNENQNNFYYIKKENFMPEQNLMVEWGRSRK